MNPDSETLEAASRIWHYHQLHHSLRKADCILVLGSHDTRVAERGADLFLEGYAPWLLFSGGLGRLTEAMWTESEADTFARIALRQGVPSGKILIENRSTNTGENIAFSYQLLQQHVLPVHRILLVQKPYMERRAYATFLKQWPGPAVDLHVTSPRIAFEAYPTPDISMEEVIQIMVGDLQRIHLYPEKGFQVYQAIPEEVWQAYEQLVQKGYSKHLI